MVATKLATLKPGDNQHSAIALTSQATVRVDNAAFDRLLRPQRPGSIRYAEGEAVSRF